MAKARILIVDDEIIIARELESRLTSLGYEIPGIASSGAEAIELATTLFPDLVLMDIVLKGDLDGIEAAEAIRKVNRVPIIYVTAYTDDKTLQRAKITEPFAYIVKPFSERELHANIEMALYRHKMETRLRKVEHWFAESIHDNSEAVIAADSDGRITVFNQGAEVITAWTRDQAIGRKIDDVLRLASPDGISFPVQDLNEGPVVHLASDTVLLARNDEAVPVDASTSCLRDEMDQPMGVVSIFRDRSGLRHGAVAAITADISLAVTQALTLNGMLQLCAESLTRNLNARLARIWCVGGNGECLTLCASAGITTSIQGADMSIPIGSTLIGRIAKSRTVESIEDVENHPDIRAHFSWGAANVRSFLGIPLVVDERLLGVLGLFMPNPVQDPLREGLLSLAHTIAVGIERKRLEEQLRMSQRIESIGQLAAGVAHDFNNLLTIISGCGDILLESTTLSDDDKSLVVEIAKASHRASSLTRQLLAFSRKQAMQVRPININELVRDMASMLKRLISAEVILRVKLDPAIAPVEADPSQLEQVILNLVLNARDAMPNGGTLIIETADIEVGLFRPGNVSEIRSGRYAMLEVRDTGTGMAPEVVEHIFEPYYTRKKPGEGTGLGLSTVYGIVRQTGGYIDVQSEPGVGSIFSVFLPYAKQGQRIGDTAKPKRELTKGTETILLVEDEGSVLALTHRVLQTCGYTVLKARNGADGLRVAAEHEGDIHLIVSDVIMPEMNGRDMVEKLRETWPDARVIFMSGYTDDTVLVRNTSGPQFGFLAKPFSPQALAALAREVLDK